MEGDVTAVYATVPATEISIHALRVEGDMNLYERVKRGDVFLSTPSGWRATLFFPLALPFKVCISIHALRVEGDITHFDLFVALFKFLSTPSGWRATS